MKVHYGVVPYSASTVATAPAKLDERLPITIRSPHEHPHSQIHRLAVIRLRNQIGPGDQTRAIKLPGERRILESLELWHARASGSPEKPKVRLYGRL